MDTVIGVREFSRNVSRVLYDLKQKRKVLITYHGKPIAVLMPVDENILHRFLDESTKEPD